MKPLALWLDEYARDHRHPTNRVLHKVCVPVIFMTIAGALHLIPYGDFLAGAAILSYLRWGFKAFAIMFLQWTIALAFTFGLQQLAPDFTLWILAGLFVLAWIGQFIGHHYEGHRPSFFTDLQYLLIGPLWIWRAGRQDRG